MRILARIIGKMTSFVLTKMGRGSSMPGQIASKIDKHILDHFTLPRIIIAVTGSSGKTSTSFMIADILRKSGLSVAHNSKGANLTNGFVTLLLQNSNLRGIVKKDALVLEVDERYTRLLFPHLKPTHVVINNITRDQPPRQGHFDVIYNCIKESLNDNMHLILNGDDPLVCKFALTHKGKISYFGLCESEESFKKPISNSLDMLYCPSCHHKLDYNFVSFGNVGDFACPRCSFKRPNLDYQITNIKGKTLTINNTYIMHAKTDIIYTYYNNIAAFAAAHLVGVKESTIISALEEATLHEKRYVSFNFEDRAGYILSGKNENAPSYNQAFNYVSTKKELKTIIFGFEYISLRYPYHDISWLYDIDFELLKDDTIDKVICIGPYAYDIASHIHVAGINPKKIITEEKIEGVYYDLEQTKGNIYAILNLGTDKKFGQILETHNVSLD